MLPFPAWYGCSITLLLESVDFTGRIKCPVGGLIETATCGVARGNGLFLSLFSRFSPATWRGVLLLGVAPQGRVWPSAVLLALLRASNDRMVCLCLGRLVIAVSGFQQTGKPVDASYWSAATTGANG